MKPPTFKIETMEKKIKVAAKLYEYRDTVKRMFGNEFEVKIKPYKDIIKAHQKKNHGEVLPSVLEICSVIDIEHSGVTIMLFLAAAVEMIEPST